MFGIKILIIKKKIERIAWEFIKEKELLLWMESNLPTKYSFFFSFFFLSHPEKANFHLICYWG